jgi:sugar lactone lactonase YvrE
MCCDEKGNLYAAQYGGGKVVVIGPCGATIGEIKLPVGAGSETTNCAFGVGPTANVLYITEAGDNVIWKVPMKVRGMKEWYLTK